MAMSYDLTNRVVFITGASRGIGRACAIEFHRAGAKVIAAARSLDDLEKLAGELGHDRILPVAMDVTRPDQRAQAIQTATDRMGAIDVLVNNAGWACFSSVLRLPQDYFDRMIAVNLAGPVGLIQLVIEQMVARGSGQIINISSVVGYQPIPRMTVYSATKSAVNGLTTGLRMELRGTGVDVLLVAPGSTDTPFFDSAVSVDVRAVRLAQNQHSAQSVARAIVRSSRRRRKEITLTPEGKLIVAIRRVSHRMADAIIYRVSKRAMPPT